MSLHQYTFLQLRQACQFASAIQTPATGSSWDDVVNDALQYLANLSQWHWREQALSLDTVADQNYIDLPDDFGEMVTIHRASPWRDAVPVSLARIQQYRAANIAQDLGIIGYLYAIVGHTQETTADHTTYRLELFPTPTLDETGALTGTYRRIVTKLVSDSDVPNIPGGPFMVALKLLCSAFAKSTEDEQEGPEWARFNAMLPDLMRADGGVMSNLGYIDGGIEDHGPSDLYLYPTNIRPA